MQGYPLDRTTLVSLLNSTPATRENAALIARLQDLVDQAQVIKEFYAFTMAFAGINAGVTSPPSQFTVDAEFDFLVQAQAYQADVAAAATTDSSRVIPNATIQLTRSGSGKAVSSAAVPVASIFGVGSAPFILPQPLLLPAGTVMNGVLTSYDAAVNNLNVRLVFIGAKLYKLSR